VFKIVKKGTNSEGVECNNGDILVAKRYKVVEGLQLNKFKTERDVLRKISGNQNKVPYLLQIIEEAKDTSIKHEQV
jgi:hypothetical protein